MAPCAFLTPERPAENPRSRQPAMAPPRRGRAASPRAGGLRDYGWRRVFTDDGVAGRLRSRPQWDACRAFLRDGDAVVVARLDRIGRSVGNLVSVAGDLDRRGVDLIVLDQAIDT